MNSTDKIYISGHLGLVGSAIERKLRANGHINIVSRSSMELDLRLFTLSIGIIILIKV